MNEAFIRTVSLIGPEAVEKLARARVIIFGVGGVGSYAAEAVARAGVGSIALVDHDTVSLSNINRQLIALYSTVGRKKTAVMGSRIRDINPEAVVSEYDLFYSRENDPFDFADYDFVLDCIDAVPSKIALIQKALQAGTPVISAMGAGNKLNPEQFVIADISETSYCPLARAVRQRLKKEGIEHLPVVYSTEQPRKNDGVPASISFVPSSAGLLMASYVIKELIK